jgi:hypothetical protein
MPACASKGKKKPALPKAWLTAGGRCAHWEAGVLEKKTALRHAWYSDVTNQPEAVMAKEKTPFDELTERQLIEHLFGRVETLEGSLRAHRATIAALMRAIHREVAQEFAQFANAARAEVLTMASIPGGQYIRGVEKLARNQVSGAEQEFGQLKELLATIA